MTHNANKRRNHNDAARALKQRVGAKAGKSGPGIRRTGYGRRLADMRKRAATSGGAPDVVPEEEE